MTPKEKAQELINKFTYSRLDYIFTLAIAIACVDEIIKAHPSTIENPDKIRLLNCKYWIEVRQELQNL